MLHLDQILSAKKDLAYPSLKHYRNAASHRRTLDDMLVRVIHLISDRCKEASIERMIPITDDEDDNEEEEQEIVPLRSKPRTRSLLVEDHSSWLRYVEGSPTRNVRKFYEAVDESSFLYKRRMECAGCPVYRVNIAKSKILHKGAGCRNRCVLCSQNTHVWCSNCHAWLCGPHIDRADEETGNMKVVCFEDE